MDIDTDDLLEAIEEITTATTDEEPTTPEAETEEEELEDETNPPPLRAAQRLALHTADAHPTGHFPHTVEDIHLTALQGHGYARLDDDGDAWVITQKGSRRALSEDRLPLVILPATARLDLSEYPAEWIEDGEPVHADELYTVDSPEDDAEPAPARLRTISNFDNLYVQAEELVANPNEEIRFLSLVHGLVAPDDRLMPYVVAPNDVLISRESLHAQAHQDQLTGRQVTVLGSEAVHQMIATIWPDAVHVFAGADH
ncbi:hypothetical protein [Streptomyces sp. CS014]|uniref:hypothetical protein n=1 Tax=Streptomyces sp. CS014 TaxID=2162707 RepID=UPI000D51730F|nr:hypothetical protein [Streptomyces sp. CS014]PVD04499.1 hypothetical protein DBP12_03475 [Streptomyces sp. CS014]